MDHVTEGQAQEPHSAGFTAESLPPESPLPQPGMDWLEQAGNVAAEPPPVTPGFASHHKRPAEQTQIEKRRKRFVLLGSRTSMKAITAFGVVGIAALIYLHFSSDKSAAADMLGTELIKLVPEFAPVPRTNQSPVDPRLADPVALDMLQLENEPMATGVIAPVATEAAMAPVEHSEETPTAALAQADLAPETHAQPQLPATENAVAPGVSSPIPNTQVTSASAPAPGVSNEELMLRLQRVELLLAQLQLQAKANTAATPAPATTPSSSPATAKRRVEPAARPAPARTVKATPPKQVKQAKAPASAPAPAPALGGQLVSVDMWNGEASVVIASGLPGDRRVRVLRPGDVVNGMALRSADPVTRSATFVAPGSQGLTLYVSQGG